MTAGFEWILLSRAMKREHVFVKSRLNPKSLAGRYRDGLAVAEFDEKGYVTGYAALWDTCIDNVYEFGSFFVDPNHRGRGLGKILFGRCQEILEREKADGIALTNSQVFEHIALQFGWEVDSRGDIHLVRALLDNNGSLRSTRAYNTSPVRHSKTLLRSWRSDEVLFPKKVVLISLGSC